MPAISVIVPIYKVEKYLAECIDSILAQTFTDFELILVDDGSPDNCGEICEEYKKKDNRIIVIHKENGGLSDARNKGIDIAKGEYLTFVDSDDLIHVDYLNTLYSLVKEYDADISMCSMEIFSDGQKYCLTETSTDCQIVHLQGIDACKAVYDMNKISFVSVMAWGKLYRSNIFQQLRYPFGRIHEDEGTTPIAFYNADYVVFTSSKLYKYRNRPNSIMGQSFSAKRFDAVHCIQICIDYFMNCGENQLASQASIYKDVVHAKLIIEAVSQKCKDQIPKEYAISEWKALKIMRKNCTDDRYCWHLAKIHPGWLLPHAYFRKLKKMIGIKCN